jgi:hypothetical protein
LFSHIFEKAFLDQLAYEFGDRRDTGVEVLAQVGEAIVAFVDAETEYPLLEDGILSVYVI